MTKKKKSEIQNKWSQPEQPPPPLFTGKKERDLTKQINDELIERVIGQTIIYYPLSIEKTNFHPLYGEAINKTYNKPIVIKALVKWDGEETTNSTYGLDKNNTMTVNFHRRRITEDQDLFVREGDIIFYGLRFFEIVKLKEPRLLFGQIDHKFEIQATCKCVREGFFHEPIQLLQVREKIRTSETVIIQEIVDSVSVPSSRCGGKIQIISGKRTSANRSQFLDYVNNSQDYKGCIVYLLDIDEDEVYGNFDQPDKFYFNEAGIWIESPLFTLP
jgi:hypothetical protein